VRVLGPGEHFGELALFTKGPRTASVQCLTAENLVLKLNYVKFLHLLNRFPEFAKCLKNNIDTTYLIERQN
jgi:CRP-like cAMP-binding protein